MADETVSQGADASEAETFEQRSVRLDLEKQALRSDAPDALKSQLLRLLSVNQDAQLHVDGLSHERALMRFAAATTKAVAFAIQGGFYVNTNESVAGEFTADDAAFALQGVAAILEESRGLLTCIELANPPSEGVRE